MSLADLFPDEDYRFSIRFERQPIAEFFGPTAQHEDLIAQRHHWLRTAPADYLALIPEALPLVEETLHLASAEIPNWQPPTGNQPRVGVDVSTPNLQLGTCNLLRALSSTLEPDLLLLKSDATGQIRLLAGCVCFPSSWNLAEKIGHPIEFIHGVVPGLNPTLGSQIHGFFSKLRPGIAWLRANWGLSRSPELNQHPNRNLPRLDSQIELNEVWLRVEHQALIALPRSQGILFGIRISVHPVATIRQDRALSERISRALKTMPEPMALYKNIASSRERLIELLAN
jgi:hypothetical protein